MKKTLTVLMASGAAVLAVAGVAVAAAPTQAAVATHGTSVQQVASNPTLKTTSFKFLKGYIPNHWTGGKDELLSGSVTNGQGSMYMEVPADGPGTAPSYYYINVTNASVNAGSFIGTLDDGYGPVNVSFAGSNWSYNGQLVTGNGTHETFQDLTVKPVPQTTFKIGAGGYFQGGKSGQAPETILGGSVTDGQGRLAVQVQGPGTPRIVIYNITNASANASHFTADLQSNSAAPLHISIDGENGVYNGIAQSTSTGVPITGLTLLA